VANLRVSLDNNAHYNNAALLGTDGTVLHYGVQIPAAEANGSTSLHIMQEAGAVKTFYIDAVKCEQGTTWTTYFDGDEPGCSWQGTKHGSASYRPFSVRSGGLVQDIVDTYGVKVQGETGYGSPTKESMLDPLAFVDGSVYQGTRAAGRKLQLLVYITGTSLANFYSLRKAFMSAISRNLVSPQQPVTFWYTGAGKTMSFQAYVDGGDEGGHMDGFHEKITLNLMSVEDPYVEELAEQSATIGNSQTLAVYGAVGYLPSQPWNATTGYWSSLGITALETVPPFSVNAFAKDNNGNLYIGGSFLNLNGIANADYIAKRDVNGVWSALSTVTDGVRELVCDATGNLYVIGNFVNLGDAFGDYIAKWNGSAWSSLGSGGGTAALYCGIVTKDAGLYVGGMAQDIGGVAAADYIGKWSGGAWTALHATPPDGVVHAIVEGKDGSIYVGGEFHNVGGVAADHVAKYNPSTASWSALGAGCNNDVLSLAIGVDGSLFVGGIFTTAGGVACNCIGRWTGSAWMPLAGGANSWVKRMGVDNNGTLHVVGYFSAVDGNNIPAWHYASWNGTGWQRSGVTWPGAPNGLSLLVYGDDVYLGFDTTGNATLSGLNSASGVVTNTATAPCYPVITIACTVATATLQEVKNETTGHTIRFNRAMQIGETITIDTRNGKESVRSDFPPPNGSDVQMLMPSDLGGFCLMPGENRVSCYAPGTGATVTVQMYWRVKHEGFEGGAA
jgi:hypothetical protein